MIVERGHNDDEKPPGTDFVKLHFGRKAVGQLSNPVICTQMIKFNPKLSNKNFRTTVDIILGYTITKNVLKHSQGIRNNFTSLH
jgi:hypothetical protein